MEPLIFKAVRQNPEIVLDSKQNIFRIWGRSAPEDAAEFYKPVLDWLTLYFQNPNSTTVLQFKYFYYNTSSSKMILQILKILSSEFEKGVAISIEWLYPQDDEDLLEAGQEYSEIAEIPFELVPY